MLNILVFIFELLPQVSFFSYFKTNGGRVERTKEQHLRESCFLNLVFTWVEFSFCFALGKYFHFPPHFPPKPLMFPLRNCLRGKV